MYQSSEHKSVWIVSWLSHEVKARYMCTRAVNTRYDLIVAHKAAPLNTITQIWCHGINKLYFVPCARHNYEHNIISYT